jgi:CheY-like chemotaxis protein
MEASLPLGGATMILIVDDHEDTRRMLALLLRHSGYAAETVPDGPAALAAMEADRPCLVILDYNMPGMSGLEVLEVIRSTPALADVPVILFTAVDADVVLRPAQQLGVQGFFRKGTLDWAGFLNRVKPFVAGPDA